MSVQHFAGAFKTSSSLLSPLEKRVVVRVLPRIPAWLQTYHLTLLTPVCSVGIAGFSWLAARDIRWLWMVSVMIGLQYVCDFLDGKVGKYRDTGLEKWGFYMDHLLDYTFVFAVLLGYGFILPDRAGINLLLVLGLFSAFMMNSFLTFATTERFHISHLKMGPTEFRLSLIVINGLLIYYGPNKMIKPLRYVAIGGLVALVILVFKTQRELWKQDMDRKRLRESKP
ncbi:MAG: CDP-alcohol phosphatidyltransferase family protein [Pyrinomonadaceae bacterium]